MGLTSKKIAIYVYDIGVRFQERENDVPTFKISCLHNIMAKTMI